MAGSTVTWFILSQADKVILSGIVSLAVFGYYTLANAIANSLTTLISGPVFNATFPRFSSLIALDHAGQTRAFYHFSAQLMAVLAFPLATVLVGFSYEIVSIWIGEPEIADTVAPIAAILVAGTGLSTLKFPPYALQ